MTIDRKRKIDLDTLSSEELTVLSESISEMINTKFNSTVEELKETLSIYGLEFNFMYELTHGKNRPQWENPQWYVVKAMECFPDMEFVKKKNKKKASKKTSKKKKVSRKASV